MKVLLLLLGATPFLIGKMVDEFIMAGNHIVLALKLMGPVFLLSWGALAFWACGKMRDKKQTMILLHGVALLDLLLVGVQELVLGAYWTSPVGTWSQLFYLPVLNLGFSLTWWGTKVFWAYLAGFLLMVGAAWIGCQVRGKRERIE